MSLETDSSTSAAGRSAASASYFGRYRDLRMARAADGVLVVRMNTRCGALRFAAHDYAEFEDAFRRIGRDANNQVIILTGADGDFVAGLEDNVIPFDPDEAFDRSYGLVAVLEALATIGAPVIAAVEGRVHAHPELALMADMIVAGEGASFRRTSHAMDPDEADVVRGVWSARVGGLRADAFLAHPLPLSAERALAWGLVDELAPPGGALARAVDLARLYLMAPEATRVALRACAVEPLKLWLTGAHDSWAAPFSREAAPAAA